MWIDDLEMFVRPKLIVLFYLCVSTVSLFHQRQESSWFPDGGKKKT